MIENKEEIGIYIHIPFCKHKCFYCDFCSFSNKDDMQKDYIECVKKEIEYKLKELKKEVTTIYIGGGTPSYIDSKYIKEILSKIKVGEKQEITIEVNPGTVTKKKLQDYKDAGVNRLSIGLQTTNDSLLKQIGRIHTYKDFLNTYKLAKEIGFNNINVDLMLGLPKQKIEDLKQSLEDVIKLKPQHISVYSLILEENTVMYDLATNKKLKLPTEEEERQMYWYVKNTLELNGYKHYEISNFCIKGMESKHNTNCWKQKEYIGIGLGASSYVDKVRYSNIKNLEEYIENIKKEDFEKNKIIEETQTEQDLEKEFMLLGLRMIDGVNIQEFKNKFVQNPIYIFKNELEKLTNNGLIKIEGNYIKLTNKGIDLANQVWEEFV